ncbi:MAG: dihydroneopterin aldolase [Balneolaceae bacterium]
MDRITLKSLTYTAGHGYYSREREEGNTFEVDVTAYGEFRPAAKNDDLSATFNYELVDEVAGSVMDGPSEKLIETLCEKIGSKLFDESKNVQKLRVSVRKLNPPIKTKAAYAEITLEWKR